MYVARPPGYDGNEPLGAKGSPLVGEEVRKEVGKKIRS